MFFSLVTGILTGIVVILYRISLDKIATLREIFLKDRSFSHIVITIFIFIIFAIISQFLLDKFPLISGSGIPQVIGLLQKKIRFNWFFELISKFIDGVLSIACGLSLGREGPSIHLGALIGDGINKVTKRSEVEEKYIITCGASAGLAAAFNAPLSGVMFAIEELHKFISPILLICILISSIAADVMTHLFLGSLVVFQDLSFVGAIYINWSNVLINIFLITILGIITVFASIIFNKLLIYMKDLYASIRLNRYIKMIIIVLLSLLVVLYFPQITGGGHTLIEKLFHNNYTIKFIFLLFIGKLIFTTVSYSSNSSGGIFLPMLVLGGLIGKIFGMILVKYFGFPEVYSTIYMLISMTTFFTAVVRAPITGIILILEMTGNFSNLFILTMAACITYIVSELLKLSSVYELLFDKMFKINNNIKEYKDIKNEVDKKIEEEKKAQNYHNKMITYKIPIAADSKVVGKKIKDLELPSHLLIIGIERAHFDFIPNGDTVLATSDVLIIFTDEITARHTTHLINNITRSNNELDKE